MGENVMVYENENYKLVIHYTGGPVESIDNVVIINKTVTPVVPRRRRRAWEPLEPHGDLPWPQENQE